MDSMVSLRLSEEQHQGVTEAAQRSGLSRSEWLRQLIERELGSGQRHMHPHELYLKLMPPQALEPYDGPRTNNAEDHSRVLKAKLRAAHRR
jgi:Ribbon-helix-helix protein, copG family